MPLTDQEREAKIDTATRMAAFYRQQAEIHGERVAGLQTMLKDTTDAQSAAETSAKQADADLAAAKSAA